MHARQSLFKSEMFGESLGKIKPIVNPDGSDTAMFDNTFEFLYLSGRSLPHVAMMMVPEPWSNHETMSDDKKAFYEYHSTLMEPWDGPAAMGFTDGVQIGAMLDRNGLRPARYYVTKDDMIILSSEAGVLDIPAEDVLYKDRLKPGRMLLVDTKQGRIISDEEVKAQIASEEPYRQWLDEHLIGLDQLPEAPELRILSMTMCSSCSSRSAIPLKTCARCWSLWLPPAPKRSARWAMMPRWPCFRTVRSVYTTTLNKCSRR